MTIHKIDCQNDASHQKREIEFEQDIPTMGIPYDIEFINHESVYYYL